MPSKNSSGKNKKFAQGKGLLIAVLLLVLGGGTGYYYHTEQKKKEEQQRLADERAKIAAAREARRKAAAERAARLRAAEKEAQKHQTLPEDTPHQIDEDKTTADGTPETGEDSTRQEPSPLPPPADTQSTPDTALEAVPLVGVEANSKANRDCFATQLRNVVQEKNFASFVDAYRQKIKESIPQLISRNKLKYNSYKGYHNLIQAVELCLMAEMAGCDTMNALAGKKNGTEFYEWLLRDKSRPLHQLVQNFVLQNGQAANAAHTLQQFHALWELTPPRERSKYLNLAIACSLLNPAACNAPGRLRKKSEPLLTVPEVYTYFREYNNKRKLITDVSRMSVSELLLVVDVRLPKSEFDWVHKNLDYKQANWGDAYGSIRYRMDRATNGVDPYKTYTFAELRKEGGVCRDQAYFAATTAKCVGIPAAYVSGDGDRGPHAWIVTQVGRDAWAQTGSYGYNTGRYTNPCSGRVHHESTLLQQSSKTADEKFLPAADAMALSHYLIRIGDSLPEAYAAARYATQAFPAQSFAWNHVLYVLTYDSAQSPNTSEWKKIHQQLLQMSSKNSELYDLAGEIESKYLLEGKSAAYKRTIANRSLRNLQRNMGDERADIVLDALSRQADMLLEQNPKNLRPLAAFYKKQLKTYAARGDVFELILRQYMSKLGEGSPKKAWNTLAKDAEKLFEKHVFDGGGDYFKLSKSMNIQHAIAEAYERAGNTKKAQKLHEDAESRLENARSRHRTE